MKKLIVCLLLLCVCAIASADVGVRGYYRRNGTYVQPYYRSSPNNTVYDNYSVYPNINPYTGKTGNIDGSDLYQSQFGFEPTW